MRKEELDTRDTGLPGNAGTPAALSREEGIRRTVEASKASFLRVEAGKTLSYHAFLYTQLRVLRKRWWVLQALLLAGLWIFLPLADDELYAYRSMGVAGSLFIILIIPELWKNRRNQCLEIESAAYYSLRQVYAARMLLFGIADVSILTVFCGAASVSMKVALTELLIQFLLPMAVTACICFGIFCSRRFFSEAAAVGACIVWSGLWWFLLLNEKLYTAVAMPVWAVLFGMALLFLAFTVYRSIRQSDKIWEKGLGEKWN